MRSPIRDRGYRLDLPRAVEPCDRSLDESSAPRSNPPSSMMVSIGTICISPASSKNSTLVWAFCLSIFATAVGTAFFGASGRWGSVGYIGNSVPGKCDSTPVYRRGKNMARRNLLGRRWAGQPPPGSRPPAPYCSMRASNG